MKHDKLSSQARLGLLRMPITAAEFEKLKKDFDFPPKLARDLEAYEEGIAAARQLSFRRGKAFKEAKNKCKKLMCNILEQLKK